MNPGTDYEAPELLVKHCKGRGITKRRAAEELGTSWVSFSQWVNRHIRPRAEMRSKIAKWSGGAVPESAWLSRSERGEIGRTRRRGSRVRGAA